MAYLFISCSNANKDVELVTPTPAFTIESKEKLYHWGPTLVVVRHTEIFKRFVIAEGDNGNGIVITELQP